jgi:hypothetical protein
MKLLGGLLFCSVLLPAAVVLAGEPTGHIRGTQEQEQRRDPTTGTGKYFQRIATFPVCLQIDTTCNTNTKTGAKIAAATDDGNIVIYTDSEEGVIGFIDIADPSNPIGMGTMDMGGEPTSVAVWRGYALVAVNTSPNFANPSGYLRVVRISDMTVVVDHDLEGKPDTSLYLLTKHMLWLQLKINEMKTLWTENSPNSPQVLS